MYVKRHAVVRNGKRYVYLRLVRAYRDENGRVRHEVLRTLGREDELKASGQLDQLAASFARLDPPPVGTRRHVGPLLLVAHYLQRLGLVETRRRRGADARAGDAHPRRGDRRAGGQPAGRTVPALRRGRLGLSSAAMAELFDTPAGLLNDDRLGRALRRSRRSPRPCAANSPWPPRSTCRVDLSRLHLDLTAVRFTGAYTGSALVEKGWAADRTVARQVKTLQATTPDGVAVYYRPHPGASSELPCFTAALERLARPGPTRAGRGRRLRPGLPARAVRRRHRRAAVRGAAARRHRLGRLVRRPGRRPATRWPTSTTAPDAQQRLPAGRAHPLPGRAARGRDHPPRPRGRHRHRLRVAYIWSSEEAASVAEARERALTKAEDGLRPHPQRPRRALLQDPPTGRRTASPNSSAPASRPCYRSPPAPTPPANPPSTGAATPTPSPPQPHSTGSTPSPPTCPTHPTGS